MMQFLAVLIAAIFLCASALAQTPKNSPVSSQFVAAKAAKVSSRVKKIGPHVCPHPTERDEEGRTIFYEEGPTILITGVPRGGPCADCDGKCVVTAEPPYDPHAYAKELARQLAPKAPPPIPQPTLAEPPALSAERQGVYS